MQLLPAPDGPDPLKESLQRADEYQRILSRPLSELSLEELKILEVILYQKLQTMKEVLAMFSQAHMQRAQTQMSHAEDDVLERLHEDLNLIREDLPIIAGLIKMKEQRNG